MNNRQKIIEAAEMAVLGIREVRAWVIESENGFFIAETNYNKNGAHGLGWKAGIENALRFSRKQDAEAIWRVCETCFALALRENAKGINERVWEERTE